MLVMDGYVRVSRVNGRAGQDSYGSPEIQDAHIRRWAEQNDVSIARVVSEEDVSGRKRIDDRELGKLVQRAEQGVTRGIVVYDVSRFARNVAEGSAAIRRLQAAGARLCDTRGADSATNPLAINVYLAMAEEQLRQREASWSASVDRAVAQQKHVACRAPVGYLRMDMAQPQYSDGKLIRNARLVPDPEKRELVPSAFAARVAGSSLLEVARVLGVSKSAARHVLTNRVYLGEARGGTAVNTDAHEPLVSEELFAAVQATLGKERRHRPRSAATSTAMLAGLITCAECGHKLQLVTSADRSGERVASYHCVGHYASGDCPARATARVELVDDHVVGLLDLEDERVAELFHGAERAWTEAKATEAAAVAELDAFVEHAAALDATRFKAGLEARQRALDEARAALYDLDDPGIDDVPTVDFGHGPVRLEGRGDNPARDRQRMRRVVARVTLAKADPARRRWQPIAERVTVTWVGE